MRHLKKFNENESLKEYDGSIDDETKSKIDSMSHQELASLWRFGSSDNKLFQGDAGKYLKWRLFDYYGGFNPSLSKKIGW